MKEYTLLEIVNNLYNSESNIRGAMSPPRLVETRRGLWNLGGIISSGGVQSHDYQSNLDFVPIKHLVKYAT